MLLWGWIRILNSFAAGGSPPLHEFCFVLFLFDCFVVCIDGYYYDIDLKGGRGWR